MWPGDPFKAAGASLTKTLLITMNFSTESQQVCRQAALVRTDFSSRSIFSIDILNAESLLTRRAIRL
jgi:hypothetical protein